jgi:hypothetical protein
MRCRTIVCSMTAAPVGQRSLGQYRDSLPLKFLFAPSIGSAASPQDKFNRKRSSLAIRYTLLTDRMLVFSTIH